jgi:hypothetical protein
MTDLPRRRTTSASILAEIVAKHSRNIPNIDSVTSWERAAVAYAGHRQRARACVLKATEGVQLPIARRTSAGRTEALRAAVAARRPVPWHEVIEGDFRIIVHDDPNALINVASLSQDLFAAPGVRPRIALDPDAPARHGERRR